MFKFINTSLLIPCIALQSYAAVTFDLDFSGAVAAYDSTGSGSLVIEILDVAVGPGAPDIDLRVESTSSYAPRSDDPATGLLNNGTPTGTDDLRIHVGVGTATSFTFSLYDGTTATPFTSLYNPGSNYGYSLVAYDLDGISTAFNGADVLKVFGTFDYIVSSPTSVNVTPITGGLQFDADGVGEVAGQAGIQDFTTLPNGPNQLPISVYFEFTNVNTFEFEYSAPNVGTGTGRNLLLDGDDLSIGDFGIVPEPSSFSVCVLGLALWFCRRPRVGLKNRQC